MTVGELIAGINFGEPNFEETESVVMENFVIIEGMLLAIYPWCAAKKQGGNSRWRLLKKAEVLRRRYIPWKSSLQC